MGPDHIPLSKRHGATSVAEFRARGYLPEALDELPGAPRLVAGRGRGAAAARRAGAALPPRGRRPQRGRVRCREAGVGESPLPEGGDAGAPGAAGDAVPAAGGLGVDADDAGDLEFLAHVVPVAAASVDRLEQVPARLRVPVRLLGGACARGSGDARRSRGRARCDRRAGRGAGIVRAADRSRHVSRGGRSACASAPAQKGKALFHPIRLALTGEAEGLELDLAVPAIERGAALTASRSRTGVSAAFASAAERVRPRSCTSLNVRARTA